MSAELSSLLGKFLDVYQREPDALARALDDPAWVFSADTPVLDQLQRIQSIEQSTQERIRSKTLLKTSGTKERHHHFQKDLGDSRENALSNTEILRELLDSIPERAEQDSESPQEADPYWNAVGVELLRLIADRLDNMTQFVERVPLENFDDVLPPQLHQVFTECHFSLALGNALTGCVLAGAMLEYGLREVCSGGKNNDDRLKKLNASGALSKNDVAGAWQVIEIRNKALHGGDTKASTMERAFEAVRISRSLLQKLFLRRAAV